MGLSHLSSLPLAVSELPDPELTPLKINHFNYFPENIWRHVCCLSSFMTQLFPQNWLIISRMALRLDKYKQDFYPGHTFGSSFTTLSLVHYWPSWHSLVSHWSVALNTELLLADLSNPCVGHENFNGYILGSFRSSVIQFNLTGGSLNSVQSFDLKDRVGGQIDTNWSGAKMISSFISIPVLGVQSSVVALVKITFSASGPAALCDSLEHRKLVWWQWKWWW